MPKPSGLDRSFGLLDYDPEDLIVIWDDYLKTASSLGASGTALERIEDVLQPIVNVVV